MIFFSYSSLIKLGHSFEEKPKASSKIFGITDILKYWEKFTVQIIIIFLTYITQLMPSLVVFIANKEARGKYCWVGIYQVA